MNDIHNQIEEWTATALAQGLSTEEKRGFDAHLAGCPECRRLYEEEKIMTATMEKILVNDRPRDDFEEQMIRKFRSHVARRAGSRRWLSTLLGKLEGYRPVALPVAAGFLAVLILSSLLIPKLDRASDRSQASQVLKEARQLDSAPDEPSLVRLPQDSKMPMIGDIPILGNMFRASNSEAGATRIPANGVGITAPEPASEEFVLADELAQAGEKSRQVRDATEGLKKKDGGQDFGRWVGGITRSDPVSSGKGEAGAGGKPGAFKVAAVEGEPVANPAPATGLPSNRKLIQNATLEFEVAGFEAALETVTRLIREEQGFVATTDSSRLANGKVRGQVILKVPPANLERLLLKLRGLGELKHQSLATQDVTKAYFDTEARLRNSQRMEERLLEMLKNVTGKVSDILQVEKELGRVREEIERMQGEIKLYDNLVSYATITLALQEKDLDQAAAFKLKEKANLSIFSPDVEKTFRLALTEAEGAKAQILHSRLDRDSSGRISAVLGMLVAAEQSETLIARFKTLGRVNNLALSSERVARGGTAASDAARVEKDKVEINFAIVHDDESRKRVNMTVVTRAVEDALEKAKAAASREDAEILASNLERNPSGQATATFAARIPARSHDALLEVLRGLGRVSQFTIQRNDRLAPGRETDDAPVVLSLTLTSEETPLQQTQIRILAGEVESQVAQVKETALAAGAEIRASTFTHHPNGQESANFVFRIPMKQHASLVDQLRGLGKVKTFTVDRQDRLNEGKADDHAPAEIALELYSEQGIVSDEAGPLTSFRRTLGEGFGSLMQSIEMLGVVIAFALPWLIVGALVAWMVHIIRRRRRAKTAGGIPPTPAPKPASPGA